MEPAGIRWLFEQVFAFMRVVFPEPAFQNVGHAKLFPDLGKVIRRAFEMLRRCARDHFEIRDFRQPCQDFILNAFREVSVVRIAASIFERQDRDRFFLNA